MKLIINMITDKLKNFYVKHAPFKKNGGNFYGMYI